MGCNCDTFLVKSDLVHTFNYEDWWDICPTFPKVNGKDSECEAPCFDNTEDILWQVFEECNLPKLRDEKDDAWCVIEINLSNIDILIDKTKALLLLIIDIQNEEDFKQSIFASFLLRWDEDLPDDFLLLLKQLRYAKQILNRFEGYSVVANINY